MKNCQFLFFPMNCWCLAFSLIFSNFHYHKPFPLGFCFFINFIFHGKLENSQTSPNVVFSVATDIWSCCTLSWTENATKLWFTSFQLGVRGLVWLLQPCLKSNFRFKFDLLNSINICRYPIYRIPTGPTLKDLDACFLTYHSLHTPMTGNPICYWHFTFLYMRLC